ncbi:hypothetical protein XELAEV_18009661mg [Xenopus laevis]|uniref:Uncharacterized protein n=1 Tax=Xenopus laevis TaxID=8355 RepID=A0A974DV61_XENLA|nr:hypothetical protein XELAEV_18009661mg [Xenopus laevis]
MSFFVGTDSVELHDYFIWRSLRSCMGSSNVLVSATWDNNQKHCLCHIPPLNSCMAACNVKYTLEIVVASAQSNPRAYP